MKITEKKGIIQWFINKWNRSVDLDIDLTDEEQISIIETARYIVPNEYNFDKKVQAVVEYWLILYIISKEEEIEENS